MYAKIGILLEFYGVRLCEPRKFRYLSVTFLGCLNCGGQKKKSDSRYKTCTFFDVPLLFINIPIPESDFLPVHHPDDFSCSCRTLIFYADIKHFITSLQHPIISQTPSNSSISLVLTLFLCWINEKVHFHYNAFRVQLFQFLSIDFAAMVRFERQPGGLPACNALYYSRFIAKFHEHVVMRYIFV